MRVRGGGARASGMGHSRDPAVLCTRRVRFWHVSDLMREGGQVNLNAGPSPQPSPRSCLAGRGRKIIRGRRNPGRRSCLAIIRPSTGFQFGSVAASTQNQAFNALLFFYRHVSGREFGKLDGVVRAKRHRYVPVVLSHRETQAILGQLDRPYRLVGLLLYGCGLRLAECVNLRVQCFNLDAMLLTVHDGKGQKDRTVPVPSRALPEIREQLNTIRRLHADDLAAGYAGVFLPRQLEKKYRNAAREFIWQWFFPAANLT